MLFCLSTFAYAGDDPVQMTYQPNGSTHTGNPKTPAAPWYVNQDGYVLTKVTGDGSRDHFSSE